MMHAFARYFRSPYTYNIILRQSQDLSNLLAVLAPLSGQPRSIGCSLTVTIPSPPRPLNLTR